MPPPFKQHGIANELEPRREFEIGPLEQLLQFIRTDISRSLDFIWIDIQIDVCLDEENIVDYKVLADSRIRSIDEAYFRALPMPHRWALCSECA